MANVQVEIQTKLVRLQTLVRVPEASDSPHLVSIVSRNVVAAVECPGLSFAVSVPRPRRHRH